MIQAPETPARWHDAGAREDGGRGCREGAQDIVTQRRAAGAGLSRVWGRAPGPPEEHLETRLPWASPGWGERGTAPRGTHGLI